MKISSAINILNKIDKINSFLILVKLKFQDDKASLQKVENAQKITEKVLINMALDFEHKLYKETPKNSLAALRIYDELEKVSRLLIDRFLEPKIKDYYLLERDLFSIIAITQNDQYLAKSSLDLDLSSADENDIKKLKEKILLIKSENCS